jgi:hypothetical protein
LAVKNNLIEEKKNSGKKKSQKLTPLKKFFEALTPSTTEIASPPHYTHTHLNEKISTQAYPLHTHKLFHNK